MRRTYIAIAALAAVVFLAVSAMLARVWSADGAESTAVTGLIQAEARGDANAMITRLTGCASNPSCRAGVAQDAVHLRGPGSVSILEDQPSTGFSLVGTVGVARVAWKTPASLPIVQCVRVKRAGDALSGLHVELLAISPQIKSNRDCPLRF
jgi:hypothetical protein